MKNEMVLPDTFNHVYEEIGNLVKQKKSIIKRVVNDAKEQLEQRDEY